MYRYNHHNHHHIIVVVVIVIIIVIVVDMAISLAFISPQLTSTFQTLFNGFCTELTLSDSECRGT